MTLATANFTAEEFLTPQQLADYLGLSIKTIYDWNSSGFAPPRRRIGNRVRYAVSDVERWMERFDVA
jgi:excisionase family DNA binding protein